MKRKWQSVHEPGDVTPAKLRESLARALRKTWPEHLLPGKGLRSSELLSVDAVLLAKVLSRWFEAFPAWSIAQLLHEPDSVGNRMGLAGFVAQAHAVLHRHWGPEAAEVAKRAKAMLRKAAMSKRQTSLHFAELEGQPATNNGADEFRSGDK